MSLASPSSYTNEDASPFSGGIAFRSVTREREERKVRKRRICLVWGCLILAILLVVLSVTGAIVLRYTLGSYGSEYQMYPGDSRIEHVPSDFCEELLTNAPGSSFQLEVTQIKSTPPLTSFNHAVALNTSFDLSSSRTFVLHVNPGTSVTLRNSTIQGTAWAFVLRGDQNYQTWLASNCKKTCFGDSSFQIPNQGSKDVIYVLNITQELNLYLVFWCEEEGSGVTVNLEAVLDLMEYQVNSSSLPNCTTSARGESNQCSLPVPYTSNSVSSLFLVRALLQTKNVTFHQTESVTFHQTESVTFTCKQRVWIYFVFVTPAIALLLISVCILGTHCCCLIREKRRTASSLPELLANDNDADWLNEL